MKTGLFCFTLALAPAAMADGLRDPTRPPAPNVVTVAAREPAPVLSAIIGPKEARIAIFNGRLVRSGGSVGAYAIEAVFETGVRYRHAGATHELYLSQAATFKKPSTAFARSPNGVQ